MPDRIPPPDERARNEAASVWMHRGMDLAAGGDPGALDEAIRCFDEAIALRRTLPLGEVPFYRYGLSAGWINRADAFARRGGAALDEAIRSYDEALALLETLVPEEDERYPRRWAITRLNQGVALQKRAAPGDAERATASFRRALAVLDRFPALADRSSIQAAAWGNLAATLASLGHESAGEARTAARNALALASPSESADPIAAETTLIARHALARLLVRDLRDVGTIPTGLVAEATDAVEEALASLRHWRQQPDFIVRCREMVRFGCRIYGEAQPRFLAEFVADHLGADGESGPLDPETFATAQAALWTALQRLQVGDFAASGLLDEVRALQAAQEMLARRAR